MKSSPFTKFAVICVLVLTPVLVGATPPALAQSGDQDCARAAAQAGAMGYGQLRRIVEKETGGKVVSAQCQRRGDSRFVYRFTVDQGNGRLVSVVIDAMNGRIISRRGG